MNGKITRNISNLYTVYVDCEYVNCNARGKFKNQKLTPLVGDNVIIDYENKYIMEILPRKNELKRPKVANVDAAIIVTSLVEPDISYNLLDKLITIIEYNHIEPIILLTKLDISSAFIKDDVNEKMKYYESLGYKVFYNNNLPLLKAYLQNKYVVLTGQSGAGKSSLINRIDETLNLETNEISKALGRGKHTTRHTEIFNIDGMNIFDTPGFSALDLSDIPKDDLKLYFIEFDKYPCPFKNCMHLKEQDCEVKNAVLNKEILETRYNNYKDFISNNESRR